MFFTQSPPERTPPSIQHCRYHLDRLRSLWYYCTERYGMVLYTDLCMDSVCFAQAIGHGDIGVLSVAITMKYRLADDTFAPYEVCARFQRRGLKQRLVQDIFLFSTPPPPSPSPLLTKRK